MIDGEGVSAKTIGGVGLPASDFLKLSLLSWLGMLGFDFLLHGGLLAGFYTQPSPFLLSPAEAFGLIPLGYLSFLLLAVLLVWLMPRLGIQGWRAGGRFGLIMGTLIWGSLVLGLISISTAPLPLMLAWFIGQSLELGLGGAIAGDGLARRNFRRLLIWIILFVVGAVVLAVVLQNIPGIP